MESYVTYVLFGITTLTIQAIVIIIIVTPITRRNGPIISTTVLGFVFSFSVVFAETINRVSL